ncbi:hypothetical protein Pth03_43320 [Planotetraspora thailandica]|uniref:Bifunctional (P)ppGpp synthetase/guanosine-3',5'-bis(Diphosphate) 3'-pyrophosphohydrolase n=1 Tax=Planotetraspora thailandica TaxID=487172 RepID=A0A8J3V365_9ACTN|nr:HD domain-containing protein [Planotetraspora thailandica]GII55943.1 hypothetical protein Pth03_43320 [Planotetraspora thailandica]
MRRFTSWKTWSDAQAPLRDSLPEAVLTDVAAAVAFAAERHADQQRPTGVPYMEHLLEALEVAVVGAGVRDRDVLVAIVLHDVVEDTPCEPEEIRDRFGEQVADLVAWVTKPPTPSGADKAAVKQGYLRALADAPRVAVLVKLADRVSNVQELHRMSSDFQRRYHRETLDYIVPLAAADPWFADWFRTWREEWRHLETDHAN